MVDGIEAVRADLDATAVRIRRLGRVPYPEAMRLQDQLLGEVLDSPTRPGTILLLEHDPVYTLGRGADEADLLGAPARFGVPVYRTGRGGGVTFHGPGQLVAYPVVRLPGDGRNVARFIRALEDAIVATCRHFAVAARALPGQTGVWAEGGKIGAIGIGVRRGVSFHGLALNVHNRIDYFESIVPCRAPGMAVTTLAREAGREIALGAVEEVLIARLCRALGLSALASEAA
jgi:lipoate-protein ligase B